MRFACLGSGSRGNASLIEGGATRVLVDCGFGPREAVRRLKALGVSPRDLDAILVTHEHGDHIRGVTSMSQRWGIDVWCTPGTWRQAGCVEVPRLRLLSSHEFAVRVGDLRVSPYPSWFNFPSEA
jgi:phosphoribosyl 1,2-cyclic phosphodiesterase